MQSRIEGRPLFGRETADLIAAVVRRMMLISMIGLGSAVVSSGFLIWQEFAAQARVRRTEEQTIAIAQNDRIEVIKELLDSEEATIDRFLNQSYGQTGMTLQQAMNSDQFLSECQDRSTPTYQLTDQIVSEMLVYVRLLAELYLVDIRLLDPLSGDFLKRRIVNVGDATSVEALVRARAIARKIGPFIQNCRFSHPLFRLIIWNHEVENSEFDNIIRPATDIKYGYGVARKEIKTKVKDKNLDETDRPSVTVELTNGTNRSFPRVIVECLLYERGREDDSSAQISRIAETNLGISETKELTVMFPSRFLRGIDATKAGVDCDVASAILPGTAHR